jgi:hypothetical protein
MVCSGHCDLEPSREFLCDRNPYFLSAHERSEKSQENYNMASNLKKQKHPGADAACTNETMPGRPGTATPKKTDCSDGKADSGFGIPDHKRKK